MEPLGLKEAVAYMLDVWSCAMTVCGAQCAATNGEDMMLKLFVDS